MINDPYIGMPIIIESKPNKPGCGCDFPGDTDDNEGNMPGGSFDNMYLGDLPLAMCYVPMQRWNTTYSLEKGLERGTIFPELDLPFLGGMKR